VSERVGSGPGDADELKKSKFMSLLSWERVVSRNYEPEFRPPAMRGESDVRNFDAEFTRERAVDSVVTETLTASQVNLSLTSNI
jgi:hypothetical protein